MSDSMRPKADDDVPPCMDFDNPGQHAWKWKSCSACGKREPLEQPAPSGWQPIETLDDCDRLVWLWTPPHRLSDRIDQEPDMRVSTCRHWTWATMWQPCEVPLPPAPGQNAVDALPPAPEPRFHYERLLASSPSAKRAVVAALTGADAKDAIPPVSEGATAKPEPKRTKRAYRCRWCDYVTHVIASDHRSMSCERMNCGGVREPFGDDITGRPHHVWRDRHGRTCVCGAKEGAPEPCPGPAIIGRD